MKNYKWTVECELIRGIIDQRLGTFDTEEEAIKFAINDYEKSCEADKKNVASLSVQRVYENDDEYEEDNYTNVLEIIEKQKNEKIRIKRIQKLEKDSYKIAELKEEWKNDDAMYELYSEIENMLDDEAKRLIDNE